MELNLTKNTSNREMAYTCKGHTLTIMAFLLTFRMHLIVGAEAVRERGRWRKRVESSGQRRENATNKPQCI